MPRILYIGSDRTLTDMTSKLLRRKGYDVRCALGEDEAFAALSAFPTDAVVADWERGEGEIILFCGRLKQLMGGIKLLLISGSEEDEIAALNAGADDWMKKPYKMNVLYARLQALLR